MGVKAYFVYSCFICASSLVTISTSNSGVLATGLLDSSSDSFSESKTSPVATTQQPPFFLDPCSLYPPPTIHTYPTLKPG